MNDQRTNLFSKLKKRIIQCEYKPGSTLNEKELCKEFKVSRTPYREALIKLEAEGLVDINPKKGVVVASIDINSLKDMFEMRSILEKVSAHMVFQRIQPRQLKALKDIVDKLESTPIDDYDAHKDLDAQFHTIITAATKNKILIAFQTKLHEQHIRLWNSLNDQDEIKKLRISIIRNIKKVYEGLEARDLNTVETGLQEHFKPYLNILVSQLISGIDIDFNYSPNGNSSVKNKS
jgi:DNA-binding GntR family transcriptional regulator